MYQYFVGPIKFLGAQITCVSQLITSRAISCFLCANEENIRNFTFVSTLA